MKTRTDPAVGDLEECCPAVLSSPLTNVKAEELAVAFGLRPTRCA